MSRFRIPDMVGGAAGRSAECCPKLIMDQETLNYEKWLFLGAYSPRAVVVTAHWPLSKFIINNVLNNLMQK